MKRRTAHTATTLAAATALLLTACGGEPTEPSDNDKIAGADQATGTPDRSPTPTEDHDRPDGVDVSLPADMELVFDWDTPTDKNEAAATADAANFLRAIYRGVDKRTTNDAAIAAYATDGGLRYANTQVKAWIDGGWTATGTLRHYDVSTRSAQNGTSVEVAFCADATRFYGKEVKTGKVLRTEPSVKDFDYYKIIMVKFPTGTDLWQASKVFVETEATKCR